MTTIRAPSPSLARLERALRTCARIVAAPGGEVYVPIFRHCVAKAPYMMVMITSSGDTMGHG